MASWTLPIIPPVLCDNVHFDLARKVTGFLGIRALLERTRAVPSTEEQDGEPIANRIETHSSTAKEIPRSSPWRWRSSSRNSVLSMIRSFHMSYHHAEDYFANCYNVNP
ncbi:hypothetical protein VTN49DRAFT_4886 [Thermomyces lanuginosus]|uniref:uncharacterized protein n=1 Tax=Thermomyces lanuginosus TaxID=5541 RepID=UPI003743DC4D